MQGIRHKFDLPILLQAIAGFVLLTLVMFGAAATVYKLIAPGGWLTQFFGSGLTGIAAALIGFLVIAGLASLSRAWLAHLRRTFMAELLVYSFAAAGFLYALQLLVGAGE